MDRNYCFRRKRHSYAACDAALAASIYIKGLRRMIEDRIGMSSLTIMTEGCDGDDRMLCELDKEIILVVIYKMVHLCIAVRNQGKGKNNTSDITLDCKRGSRGVAHVAISPRWSVK